MYVILTYNMYLQFFFIITTFTLIILINNVTILHKEVDKLYLQVQGKFTDFNIDLNKWLKIDF